VRKEKKCGKRYIKNNKLDWKTRERRGPFFSPRKGREGRNSKILDGGGSSNNSWKAE